MKKWDDDDSWELEAQASFSAVAESEFTRFKTKLKQQAGLVKKSPLQGVKETLCQWMASVRGLLQRLVQSLRPRR